MDQNVCRPLPRACGERGELIPDLGDDVARFRIHQIVCQLDAAHGFCVKGGFQQRVKAILS